MEITERLRQESPCSIPRGHESQVLMEDPTVQITQQLATIEPVDQTKTIVANTIQNVIFSSYPSEQRSEGPGERHHATPGIRLPYFLEPRVTEQQTLAQALVRVRHLSVPDPVIVVIAGSPSDEQPPIRSQPHGVGAVKLEAARD
jgi:hypothetical protein